MAHDPLGQQFEPPATYEVNLFARTQLMLRQIGHRTHEANLAVRTMVFLTDAVVLECVFDTTRGEPKLSNQTADLSMQ